MYKTSDHLFSTTSPIEVTYFSESRHLLGNFNRFPSQGQPLVRQSSSLKFVTNLVLYLNTDCPGHSGSFCCHFITRSPFSPQCFILLAHGKLSYFFDVQLTDIDAHKQILSIANVNSHDSQLLQTYLTHFLLPSYPAFSVVFPFNIQS